VYFKAVYKTFVERLRKATNIFRYDNRFSRPECNSGPSENKAEIDLQTSQPSLLVNHLCDPGFKLLSRVTELGECIYENQIAVNNLLGNINKYKIRLSVCDKKGIRKRRCSMDWQLR
jgi:hypothetical protein